MKGIYHYKTLSELSNKTWNNSYNRNDVQKYFVMTKTPYYLISKGYEQYLLNTKNDLGTDTINDFPMRFDSYKETCYGTNLYKVVDKYTTIEVKPEKTKSFRELINEFAPFDHSSPLDFLLFKIIAFTSLIDRTNIIVSTPAGFGKDSVSDILGYFLPQVSKITPTSMAALTYRLENRLLVINEVTDLRSEDLQMLQQFLSTAGAFNNSYENPKRGNSGYKTKDVFDISKLSISLFYNTYEYFVSKGLEKKYFDYVFKEHISDRFLPIRLDGYLKEDFHKPDYEILQPEQYDEYRQVLKNINYYVKNPIRELRYKTLFDLVFPISEFKTRHRTSLYNIAKYIAEYCGDDEMMFSQLIHRLRKAVKAYILSKKIESRDVKLNQYGMIEPYSINEIIDMFGKEE